MSGVNYQQTMIRGVSLLPIKRTGISKAKMQKKNDTEFSRELSDKTQRSYEKLSGADNKISERPGNYGIYPGE